MKYIYLIVCIAFVTSSNSCNKDNDKQGDIVTYYYDETQCANPWGTGQTMDEKITELKIFLKDKDIEWKSIELKEETDLLVDCEACNCGTGYRFYLKIVYEFSKKVEDIGFKHIQ